MSNKPALREESIKRLTEAKEVWAKLNTEVDEMSTWIRKYIDGLEELAYEHNDTTPWILDLAREVVDKQESLSLTMLQNAYAMMVTGINIASGRPVSAKGEHQNLTVDVVAASSAFAQLTKTFRTALELSDYCNDPVLKGLARA